MEGGLGWGSGQAARTEGTPLPRGGAEIRHLLSQGSCLQSSAQDSVGLHVEGQGGVRDGDQVGSDWRPRGREAPGRVCALWAEKDLGSLGQPMP